MKANGAMRVPLRRRLLYAYFAVRYRYEGVLFDLGLWRNRLAPTPHAIKRRIVRWFGRRYALRTLVETGTYMGDMVAGMSRHFDALYTIELQPSFYQKACARFARKRHIQVLHGDSGTEIARLLPLLRQPALFWLDAHYSGGATARGELDTPVVSEIEQILASPVDHVILIDDARSFTGRDGYPTVDGVRQLVQRLRPAYRVDVAQDIIRLTPALR